MSNYTPLQKGLGNVSSSPYWLKTPEFNVIAQERQHHNEAVYAYGEYSMFILMWHTEDYFNGLCQRCPSCWNQGDQRAKDVADVYDQSQLYRCPQCYGSTFYSLKAGQLGGLKARIVRPCLWDAADVRHNVRPQGEIDSATSTVQSISDFRMRSGDFVFRADQTRWRVETIQTDSIITGFQAQDDIRTMVGYQYPQCRQESDPTSVSFIIPPDGSWLKTNLDISVIPNYPISFTTIEVLNGPLIADDFA